MLSIIDFLLDDDAEGGYFQLYDENGEEIED
jgi:hypothetical protein